MAAVAGPGQAEPSDVLAAEIAHGGEESARANRRRPLGTGGVAQLTRGLKVRAYRRRVDTTIGRRSKVRAGRSLCVARMQHSTVRALHTRLGGRYSGRAVSY